MHTQSEFQRGMVFLSGNPHMSVQSDEIPDDIPFIDVVIERPRRMSHRKGVVILRLLLLALLTVLAIVAALKATAA